MFDYIQGKVAEINPALAVIDCGGVGFEIFITVNDYSRIEGNPTAKLYIHESIREDAHVLFGFTTKRSRELFRLLNGVSGVGPNTARQILSTLDERQLEDAIATGNEAAIKAVKGVGAKTAQRIIVDLHDKINSAGDTLSTRQTLCNEAFEESLAALTTLGFTRQQSEKALRQLFKEDSTLRTQDAVKRALKMM